MRRALYIAFIVYAACLIIDVAVIGYTLTYGDTPPRRVFWYHVMKVCHKTAFEIGKLGITAERKYRTAPTIGEQGIWASSQ